MIADALYGAARRVLLDALDTLADQRDAIIIAGAQAVYLRTGDPITGVAPYTTDGDVALDPTKLTDEPSLGAVMNERFQPKLVSDGSIEPGIWLMAVDVDGEQVEIPIDLIVPAAIAGAGRRGARLGPHGNRVARRAVGLEAALLDHGPMAITALEPGDERVTTCEVAGPTALLVAKAHKIHDRLEARDRLVDKDAADVYRLMLATPVEQVNEALAHLLRDDVAGSVTRHATGLLRQLFGAAGTPGVRMAIRSFGGAVPPARVGGVCASFIAGLRTA